MHKIISIAPKHTILTNPPNYDGTTDQIRTIYQDCCDEMQSAKWSNTQTYKDGLKLLPKLFFKDDKNID